MPTFAEGVEELVVVEPVQGVVDVIGAVLDVESGTIGLRPAVSVSVEPSGILPPIRAVELVAGVEVEADVPLVDDDVQLAVALIPPSNVERTVDVLPLIPDDCEEVELLVPQVEPVVGLKPPGSSSVDPSGMLELVVPLVPVEPSVPSGEVAPMPDGATAV